MLRIPESIMLWLVVSTMAAAQGLPGKNNFYVSVSAGTGQLFNFTQTGSFAIAYPYTIRDANGNTTQQLFASAPGSIDYKFRNIVNSLSIEMGHLYFVNMRAVAQQNGFGLGGAFGKNIYISGKGTTCKCWVFKPSLGAAIVLNHDSYIDAIDNRGVDIIVDDHEFLHSYLPLNTLNIFGIKRDANTVDVMYRETDIALVPRISFGQNNFKHLFYWDVNIAYYIPVYKRHYLHFVQDGNQYSYNALLDNNSLDQSTYENQSLRHAPGVLSGLMVGVSVGLSFSKETQGRLRKKPHYENQLCECKSKH